MTLPYDSISCLNIFVAHVYYIFILLLLIFKVMNHLWLLFATEDLVFDIFQVAFVNGVFCESPLICGTYTLANEPTPTKK